MDKSEIRIFVHLCNDKYFDFSQTGVFRIYFTQSFDHQYFVITKQNNVHILTVTGYPYQYLSLDFFIIISYSLGIPKKTFLYTRNLFHLVENKCIFFVLKKTL